MGGALVFRGDVPVSSHTPTSPSFWNQSLGFIP
eukprot:SAG11_NODE_52009_length_108_cov_18.666667_1_plen_32_part_01